MVDFFVVHVGRQKKRLVKYTNTYSIYRIHVWYFYLHLPYKWTIHVGKYTYHTRILWNMLMDPLGFGMFTSCLSVVFFRVSDFSYRVFSVSTSVVGGRANSLNKKQTETKHKEEIAIKHTTNGLRVFFFCVIFDGGRAQMAWGWEVPSRCVQWMGLTQASNTSWGLVV